VKVAYASPLPPERSGIADYSELLVPALMRRAEVELLKRSATKLPRGTDVALYHVGNNPDAHGWIVDLMRRHRERVPALVVLHEFVLHHLVAGLTLGRGEAEEYRVAMQREAGPIGRLLAHAVVDGLVPPLWEVRAEDFPLASTVLDLADVAVVHSRYVQRLVEQTPYTGRVRVIPHPVWSHPPEQPDSELPAEALLIGSVGYLNPSKRIPQLVAAFARLKSSRPGLRLVLAGAASRGLDVESMLARHELEPSRDFIRLDFVPHDRLWPLLARLDVCVSLRWPTMGETSGVALRALALGRPLVVTDVGWFAELPDHVVAKIAPGGGEVDALTAALARLVDDVGARTALSRQARDYVHRTHDLDDVADRYVAALEEAAGGRHVDKAVLDEVSRAALDVGIDPHGREAGSVGRSAREVGLGG
jgi:glycosyltransferase involved in cell wall biosynthesis